MSTSKELPLSTSLTGLREFRLLWLSGLLAAAGAQMSGLALPLLILRQTHSAVEAGTVGTVSMGALLITMLPGGTVADLVERRRLMRLCDVGSLLAVTALAIAVLTGRSPLVLVLIVAGSGAVLTSFYGPASFGLLRAVVPPDAMGIASSRMQARSAAARMIGPLVGGVLFGWHPAAPFIAEAIALLLSTTCLAFMRTRSVPDRSAGKPLSREELGAGLAFLWHQPYLRTVLLVFGLGMNAAFGGLMFVALATASRGGHSGIGGGLVGSLAAAGSLTGALLAPRIRPGERTGGLIIGTCWACAGAVGVLVITSNPVVIGLLVGLCMVLASLASIGFLTALLVATPEAKVGRVQSAATLLSSMAQPLGPVVAGALLGAHGPGATFAVLAGVFAVCAMTVTAAPSVRRGPVKEAGSREDGGPAVQPAPGPAVPGTVPEAVVEG